MPPLPTLPRPASNCGLMRMTASVSEGAAAKTGASSSVAEMNETSMTSSVSDGLAWFCECAGCEKACIGALDEANARVVAELHGDLAEAGVDGGDVRGAALQQAVRKAAGGGADVEAGSAGDVDLPVVEGGLKFESAAADVGHVVAEEADGGIGCDGGAGLVDFLFVDQDAAGEDEGAGALAALDQAAVDEQEIDAGFAVCGQGFSSFPGS